MGLFYAISILVLWLAHLSWSLAYAGAELSSPMIYVHMILQAWLYTGLFITGHDAMHGTVIRNKGLNRAIGILVIGLFAAMSYKQLLAKHKLHHQFPGEAGDPDYAKGSQNFWLWWLSFMRQYITLWQLLLMAVAFNVLQIFFPKANIILYWVIPSFLATLQLFYFGTYLPHRLPHEPGMEPHRARTQRKNHLWAMLSCYFFGYHYEHHASPGTPWWRLWTMKSR